MTGPAVEIVSFGYGHSPAPTTAHVVVDVRHHFKDPHIDPAVRHLTATDTRVVKAVMNTPGVAGLVTAISGMIGAFMLGPRPGPLTIAVGCVGGRHRSAVIAIEVARLLQVPARVSHRDIDRPVIERPTAGRPARGGAR